MGVRSLRAKGLLAGNGVRCVLFLDGAGMLCMLYVCMYVMA